MQPTPTPPPLRVALDATAAAAPRPTGVGLSIAQLVAALRERDDLAVRTCYRLSRVRRRAHFLPGRATLYHEWLSIRLARRLDVWHGMDSRLPRFGGPALVATVHDLSARRAEFASDRFRRTREGHWAAAAARARLLVTYTDAVRREVVRELGVPADRVAVVPLAPGQAVAPPDPARAEARVRARIGDGPFALCLGELSHRKNTAAAVSALAAGVERLGGLRLVLVGPAGRGADAIEDAIAASPVRGRILRLAYLPAADAAALLARARALLFPSRYEGFGMPVLEAFRAGVPVVASTAASVVEVAGGAALHADPDDPDGLAAALAEAVNDEPSRRALIERGRARVACFSWERAARELTAVYQAAAAGAPAPAPTEATCPN